MAEKKLKSLTIESLGNKYNIPIGVTSPETLDLVKQVGQVRENNGKLEYALNSAPEVWKEISSGGGKYKGQINSFDVEEATLEGNLVYRIKEHISDTTTRYVKRDEKILIAINIMLLVSTDGQYYLCPNILCSKESILTSALPLLFNAETFKVEGFSNDYIIDCRFNSDSDGNLLIVSYNLSSVTIDTEATDYLYSLMGYIIHLD